MKNTDQTARAPVVALLLAGLAVPWTPQAVRADTTTPVPLDGPTRIVRVADLDLSHEEGVRTLETRVRHAVDSVCDLRGYRDARSRQRVRECRDAAYADAMAQLHALGGGERAVQAPHGCGNLSLADSVATVSLSRTRVGCKEAATR